jgi:uracil-DNA glycosylase
MKISDYQKDCFRNYKSSIGYPEHYRYLHGTPINALVPIETVQNNVMVVGAYPSAKFYKVEGSNGSSVADTPVADNDAPFSNESYFDGSRVRTIPSGKELNEVILQNIGVNRSECWITDLVKVFLFKEGHVNRYKKLGKTDIEENRSRFYEYAQKSLPWLNQEIEICNPYVIILLGTEVTSAILNVPASTAKSYLDGDVRQKQINQVTRNFVCLPHPGIIMKRMKKNPWPERFEREISVTASHEINKLKKDALR